MPSIIIYTLAGFLIMFILLEIIPLIKRREWRQLILSVLIFSITLLYSIDFVWRLNILPNPNRTLFYLQPVSEIFERLLHVNN